MERRDRAFDRAMSNYESDRKRSLQIMMRQLKSTTEEPVEPSNQDHGKIDQKVLVNPLDEEEPLELRNWLSRQDIQIATISAAAIDVHLRNKRSDVFVTSLHCIDKAISQKRERLPELSEVKQKLPQSYHDYADVFLKSVSDQLPPHRSCDIKIEIEEDKSHEQAIGHAPLYKISLEELEAVRTYILENLQKGFLMPSTARFASPILMVHQKGKI